MSKSKLRTDIEHAINCNCGENGSDTPDFILAEYLINCLANFDNAVKARSKWYGHHCHVGGCNHKRTDITEANPPTEMECKAMEDSPIWRQLKICPKCEEEYNKYGCEENVCHAPPKLSDLPKSDIITGKGNR